MKKILLVTINFRNSNPTIDLIKSLESCVNKEKLKLVLVDNESTQKSKHDLLKIKKNSSLSIEILNFLTNKYYWSGAKLALDKYLNTENNFDWIIICNNDIIFNDINLFKNLLNLNEHKYGIIAPKIKSNISGKNLNPFMINPISIIEDMYYQLYYSNFFISTIVHKIGRVIKKGIMLFKYKKITEKKIIYAPHGSCVIFSKNYFSKGGFLDTGFTMYGEEVSIAEISKKINSPIYYLPSLSLVHNEHQSTSKSSFKSNFMHSKKTYYYLKSKYRN